MTGHISFTSKNRLLRALPLADLERLVPSFERIQLTLRQSLEKAHKPIDFVYFLESGLGSVVATKHGGMTIEVGLFGRDGMSCWFSRGTEPVFPPRSEPPLSMVF